MEFTLEKAYEVLFSGALLFLAILIGLMLIRSVIGPRITDRILSINMIGTMVIACICILSRFLNEGYLADIALIYAMVSFIALMVLSRVYIPKEPKRPRFAPEALEEEEVFKAEPVKKRTGSSKKKQRRNK